MIFDAHVHIWSDDRQSYPQTGERARPASDKGSVEWLLELMQASGVSAALLVQVPWYGEDNRYYVDSMERFPGRFAALGYLPDPLAPDAPERLDLQYYRDAFRGIRIHMDEQRIVDGLAVGAADHLIARARDLNVPVQFLNRIPERHAVILEVAKRFPDVRFINDHLGHPRVAEGYPYDAARTVFACGALPNVYAKVSMHHMLSSEAYPWRDLHDFQRMTLEAYGPERLMWGSNFPMSTPEPSYQQRLDAVRRELPFLTDDERAWILGRTAATLWALSAGAS